MAITTRERTAVELRARAGRVLKTRPRTKGVAVATDVMLVPAALGDTTPVYLKMMEVPAAIMPMAMPGTSFGELPLAFGLAGVPKVSMSTPADSVICTDSVDVH